MQSTIASKPLVEVEKINLVLKAYSYRSVTLRDAFVAWVKRGFTIRQADRLHVLKDVSFAIYPGQRVGLLGINGAGKTSLCRLIAGLYKPTTGQIKNHGQVRAIFDTGVGIQEDLTGRENLKLLSQFVCPGDRQKQKALVKEAEEFSELGEFLDAPFKIYSNGMQARLALSLITAVPSDILVLDEVFDGADQFFREKMAQRMMKTIAESGAVIFVSHTPSQIQRVCNRVLVLCNGELAYDGGVEDGLEFYRQTGRLGFSHGKDN